MSAESTVHDGVDQDVSVDRVHYRQVKTWNERNTTGPGVNWTVHGLRRQI